MSTTPSPLLIRLDARALAALFPEGSQARVDLQQAVIAEFVRKQIKPSTMGPAIRSMIDEATAAAQSQALKDLGITTGTWGSVTLSDKAKADIKMQTQAAISETVNSRIQESSIEGIATEAANRITDDEIRRALRTRVITAADQMFKGGV